MKIVTLTDNRTQTDKLDTEHGLSLYIETDCGQKVLYDTGQSDLFMHNAKKLGVDFAWPLRSCGWIDSFFTGKQNCKSVYERYPIQLRVFLAEEWCEKTEWVCN